MDVSVLKSDKYFPDVYCCHLLKNRPCLFDSDWTLHWRSVTDWVKQDGSFNIPWFRDHFGGSIVSVLNQKVPSEHCSYENVSCSAVSVDSFLSSTVCNVGCHEPDLSCSSVNLQSNIDSSSLLYAKDWHFRNDYPNYDGYRVLAPLTSDWLNEYYDQKADCVQKDYRFVYLGTRGTWTPFHADVFRSFSWSTNVCGRKLWYLVPPGTECMLADADPTFKQDLRVIDYNVLTDAGVTKLVQLPGQTIFVPSGWHHQVHNLDDHVVSINHNWLNAANVNWFWSYLTGQLQLVEQEIEDCRASMSPEEFRIQCQLVLKADVGMDFDEFGQMMTSLLATRSPPDSFWLQVYAVCPVCGLNIENCDRTDACLAQLQSMLTGKCRCQSTEETICSSCAHFLNGFDYVTLVKYLKLVDEGDDK